MKGTNWTLSFFYVCNGVSKYTMRKVQLSAVPQSNNCFFHLPQINLPIPNISIHKTSNAYHREETGSSNKYFLEVNGISMSQMRPNPKVFMNNCLR